MSKKLLLIDGNSVANRAFYALPMLSNKQGVYTNAALGFTMMLLKILEDEKPDYIACIFDAGKVTFRHTVYKEYKGKREKTPHELSGQFPIIKSILEAFDIPSYELVNYEADDIMGTFAMQAVAKQVNTALISGDKDTFQLVNDTTVVYMTKKGISDIEVIDEAAIMEKYNLHPSQMIDLKGLMGDASDNIPGVPGVGEKTALKLLQEYEKLENVLENIDKISGKKLKERLLENIEQAKLSKQLATIDKNVPIILDWELAKYSGYIKDKIRPLFEEYEFKQLSERLGLGRTENDTNEGSLPSKCLDFQIVHSEMELLNALSSIDKSMPLSVYIETDGTTYHTNKVIAIAMTQGHQHFVCSRQLVDSDSAIILKRIQDKQLHVFDAKRVYYISKQFDVTLENIKTDSMLMNYVIDPTNNHSELADLAETYGLPLAKDEQMYGKNRRDINQIMEEQLYEYVVAKSNAIEKLSAIMERKLSENIQEHLLHDIELPLSFILADMERQGIQVDGRILETIGKELAEKITAVTKEIYEMAGEEFNINSPKQMGVILFDKLGLPPIKKTKTGYSTSADVLEKLANQHPIVEHILHHRQLVKLQSTYIEGLLKVINKDTNKIHTYYNQALTATGRLSSTEPNLQNIPIRLEEGRKIRKAFVPSEIEWKLLAADYSQIELRILAHISQDKNLMEAFHMGIDIHTKTASDVFGVPIEEVTSTMRRQAKAVNFGIVYGISDYGLSQNLDISRKQAKEFIERYFANFQGVKDYMDQIVKIAKKQGYVQTILHRRRYLPEINSPNFNLRSFAERTAMNTPIQGTAADIIKLAMVKLAQEMQRRNLESRMLLQVHDELIFEVPEHEIEIMTMIVPDIMENCTQLAVPLKVDVSVGENWYTAK